MALNYMTSNRPPTNSSFPTTGNSVSHQNGPFYVIEPLSNPRSLRPLVTPLQFPNTPSNHWHCSVLPGIHCPICHKMKSVAAPAQVPIFYLKVPGIKTKILYWIIKLLSNPTLRSLVTPLQFLNIPSNHWRRPVLPGIHCPACRKMKSVAAPA